MSSPAPSSTVHSKTQFRSTGRISTDRTRPSTTARRPAASWPPARAGPAAAPLAAVATMSGSPFSPFSTDVCRACNSATRVSTSKGTIVAAQSRTRLTTAESWSAVRSCSRRPSSGEKDRRGSTTVTCVPGGSASVTASSAAARVTRRSGVSIISSGTSSPCCAHFSRSLSACAASTTKWTARKLVGRSPRA
ncbi:MAG TPA: hypothetical protein VH478_03965 [Trebonia sp.]|nr:hypothetical protein [Trebonia sp.]